MYILGTGRLDSCRHHVAPSCHIAALTFLSPCLGSVPNIFVTFVLLRHFPKKEDTGRGIIFVLNSADPGSLSSDLFRLLNKVSNNCFCKFMWLFMGLFIDIVFMIPLLSENEIKYIM